MVQGRWSRARSDEKSVEAGIAVAAIQTLAVLAAVWLSGRRRLLDRGLPYLVSLAVGVLLATALLHILPEAISSVGNREALWIVFTGTIFSLFCVERAFAAITGHTVELPGNGEPDCGPHHHRGIGSAGLVFGGMLHSFVDGVSVAAAFAAGRQVGWLTAGAITLHEVPHRMGDYALLTHLGLPRRRAMELVILVAMAALAGVLLVLLVGHAFAGTTWLLPVSAASFVYIALVNLMPELAGEQSLRRVAMQVLLMLAGGLFVGLLLRLPGL